MTEISSHIKKQNVGGKIIHPVFLEAAVFTEDNIWKDIFKNASKGKLPKGFIIQNDIMKYRKGTKISQIPVPKEPLQCFINCKNFIKVNGSIFSDNDKTIQDTVSTDNSSSFDPNKLKKNKYDLGQHIDRYCKNSTNNDKDYKAMLFIANMVINFGIIEHKDISFDNEGITDIKGLLKNENGYCICPVKLNSYLKKKKTVVEKKKKYLSVQNWTKYLITLFK